MESYEKLVDKKKFVGNQPIIFNKKNYDSSKTYYTTFKLDGQRHLMLVSDSGNSLITSKMEFKKLFLPKVSKEFNGTLLDGELFNGRFYAFDILFFKGIDIRKQKFLDRLETLLSFTKKIRSKKLVVKEYNVSGSLCENFISLKKKFSKEMENGIVDGIIFVQDSEYNSKILKWKPKHLLSIDFKIKKLPENKFELLVHTGKPFSTKGYPKIGITDVSEKDYKLYPDGSIVEFIFNGKKFIPIKHRIDKVKPNYIVTILSNFEQIIRPLDLEKFLCK